MSAVGGGSGLLGDIFGLTTATSSTVSLPKVIWLPAEKGKGLEISGTFSRRNGQVSMDMTFTNKAMQAMSGFAIQLNKNSFGLSPAAPLQVGPLPPSQSLDASLILTTTGQIQRMEPLNNLQVNFLTNFLFVLSCLNFSCHSRLLSKITLTSFISLVLCTRILCSSKMVNWINEYF